MAPWIAFLLNLVLTAVLVSFCSLLARKEPRLAGFIVSLPLSTLIILALTHFEGGDVQRTAALAKSILIGLPVSLLFFIPFFPASRGYLSFWQAYALGIALLGVGYVVHRQIFGIIQ